MFGRTLILVILIFVPIGVSARAQMDGAKQEKLILKKTNPPSVIITSFHQWVLQRMISWLPPGRSFIKDAIETSEEGKARYEKIADAAISVIYDPDEKPIFGGKYGRAKTLALILSVAYFESGYRKDVDLGVGPLARGDEGQSWCMMQIMLGHPDSDGNTQKRVILEGPYYKMYLRPMEYTGSQMRYTPGLIEGWGGLELITDRQKCFRVGLHAIRRSFHSCRAVSVEDRLSVYGAGKCIANMEASRVRVRKAQKWLEYNKPPLTDEEVMKLLHPSGITSDDVSVINIGSISGQFNTQSPSKIFPFFWI